MSKARLLADLMRDSQITASEITGLQLNSIQEGDTVVEVEDGNNGNDGKIIVRVDNVDTAEINPNGMVVPKGTTAERNPSPALGELRYNTTIGFFETYTTSGWGSIATPPSVTGISPQSFNGEAGATFVITGAFFDAATTAIFKGADGTEYSTGSVTFNSNTQITITNGSNLPVANEPYKVKVTNGAGLATESSLTIDAGSVPSFTTAQGNIHTTTRWDEAISVTVQATDAENTITGYSLVSGSLPPSLSLDTSTGVISGTSTEQATTTYTFTIGATDSAGNTNTRQFDIQIVNAAPTWSSPADGATIEVETNSSVSETLSATDLEGRPVTYSLASGSLPTGVTISGNLISGTAPSSQSNNSITLRASDGYAESLRNIYFNVTQPFQTQFISLSTFSTQNWSYTGSIQSYTIPETGSYEIDMGGGRGGRSATTDYAPSGFNTSLWRGLGRVITVKYNFQQGEVIKYVVGNMANDATSGNGANGGGAGGGGSFLWLSTGNELVAAAGGGGGGSIINTNQTVSYLYGRNGNTANDGLASWAGYYGGTNGGDGRGLGGGSGNSSYTAKGWNTMIAANDFSGRGTSSYGSVAGYGGGGLMLSGDHAGGGGGGYSGGGYGHYGTNTGIGNSDGRNGGGGGGSFAHADARYSDLGTSTQNGAGYITLRPATS